MKIVEFLHLLKKAFNQYQFTFIKVVVGNDTPEDEVTIEVFIGDHVLPIICKLEEFNDIEKLYNEVVAIVKNFMESQNR